jgi:3'-phosphoadenosine 5'-phosphosulfate (PAPS) 3'-phosphatase
MSDMREAARRSRPAHLCASGSARGAELHTRLSVDQDQHRSHGTGFPFSAPQHLDAYLRVFGELFHGCRDIPWDMAAGSLIVREAGGTVGDFFGREGFLESGNIVAASPAVFDAIVEATRRHFASESVAGLATRFIV